MIQFNPLTKIPLLALLLAVAGSTSSWAQSYEDIRLEREARWAVFKNVNLYSSNASVKPGESDGFFGLFSDNSALHVVDFPMFNNVRKGESVPVNEYVQKYQSLFKQETRAMSLSLKHMTYVRSSSHLEIRASVTKEFKGATTENGWKFDDPIFERNLELIWRCNNFQDLLNHWENPMDSNGRKKKKPKLEFRIHEVTWHPSQHQDWVMMVNEAGLQAETCGEPQILRGYGPGLGIYVSESPIWVIRDTTSSKADTKMSAPVFSLDDSPSTILEARSFQAQAKSRRLSWALSAGTGHSLLGRLDSEHAENTATRAPLGTMIMANLGWAIFQNHEEILDVWLGVGASIQQHALTADRVYFEEPETDPDNFAYLRQTSGSQWSESLSESLGNVSLGLRYLNRIPTDPNGSMNYFGFSTGFTQAIQSSTSFDNTSTVVRQGFYEDLFGITIDENGIYDFGTYTATGEASDASWSLASTIPLHAVYARKRDALTPWISWVQVGPSLHFRTGTPSDEGPFISNSQLRSTFLESSRYSFVNLDVQFGIRKRIGWNSIDPCDPQP
jgi:hypothetical protein